MRSERRRWARGRAREWRPLRESAKRNGRVYPRGALPRSLFSLRPSGLRPTSTLPAAAAATPPPPKPFSLPSEAAKARDTTAPLARSPRRRTFSARCRARPRRAPASTRDNPRQIDGTQAEREDGRHCIFQRLVKSAGWMSTARLASDWAMVARVQSSQRAISPSNPAGGTSPLDTSRTNLARRRTDYWKVEVHGWPVCRPSHCQMTKRLCM